MITKYAVFYKFDSTLLSKQSRRIKIKFFNLDETVQLKHFVHNLESANISGLNYTVKKIQLTSDEEQVIIQDDMFDSIQVKLIESLFKKEDGDSSVMSMTDYMDKHFPKKEKKDKIIPDDDYNNDLVDTI